MEVREQKLTGDQGLYVAEGWALETALGTNWDASSRCVAFSHRCDTNLVQLSIVVPHRVLVLLPPHQSDVL